MSEVRMEPFDEFNRELVGNVHPSDWNNPKPQDRYHLVVIGAGTAGLVTSIVAAGLGAKVALVERHLMGGDCLNVGCVPSKGLISAARAWAPPRDPEMGAPPSSGAGDFAAAMRRMRRLRAKISHIDGAQRFTDAGVDVFLGSGRFTGNGKVQVGDDELRYRRAVIATGARAAAPPIPGLDGVDYLTNETVFSLTELPPRLAIVGAGPIGCEMAQAFARFGCEVTLIDIADRVLIREDGDAAEVVQRALVRDGVRLELGVQVSAVSQKDGIKRLSLVRDQATLEVDAEELLVAVGRAPNVEGLGLEEVGVAYDEAGVHVDSKLRTTHSKIFAAGDVTKHLKFTHLADAHAAIVIQNALFFGRAKTDRLVVPWCTYTSPEIAHVGLYEADAQRLGHDTDVFTVRMDDVDRALLEGEDEGFLRVVTKKGTDKILGATLVAEHAGDMIGALSLAITHDIGLGKFAGTIFPYPTQGEILKKVANQWRRTRLSPFAQRVLGRFFRLTG